jgi:hypothetical protein
MAYDRILRRSLYLFAGALVGTSSLLASSAADARARQYHGAHSSHFARPGVRMPVTDHGAAISMRKERGYGTPKTAGPSDKGDGIQPSPLTGTPTVKGIKQPSGGSKDMGAGAPGKDASAPDFHRKNSEPIDTRITVQPPLHGPGLGPVRQAKIRIGPLSSRYSHLRHPFTPAKAGRVTRNAIGLPVTRSAVLPLDTVLVRSSSGSAPGVAPSGGDGLAKPNPGSDRVGVFPPGPVMKAMGTARPGLNGNGFVRRGFVPATLGGPTKNVVVGINGSTIRPKH